MRIKQVIIAREDLNMSPGKLAAQVAHASIAAYEIADKEHIDAWKRAGVTKVVLGVGSEATIIALYKVATSKYLPTSIVCDEGRTEVSPGTITVVGIGPAPEELINEVTGHLRLYGKDVGSEM
jgi:PTH2 family peptidyl-tRNA hydrolase